MRTGVCYPLLMARQPRNAADDCIYHVFNRGNCKMDIFTKPGDFESFIKLLEEGRRRFNMRILGYILMDNHWHLALWPRRGEDLAVSCNGSARRTSAAGASTAATWDKGIFIRGDSKASSFRTTRICFR